MAPGAETHDLDPGATRGSDGDHVLLDLLDATHALLWIRTPAETAEVARRLVHDLGGRIVPATAVEGDAIPVDLSFGASEPVLPAAPPATVERMLLERYLPGFVRDAHRALELADQAARLAEDAGIDPLTQVANRRTLSRALGRLSPDDTVVMIDLDHFKKVNDTFGHGQGDEVLRTFGGVLSRTVRASDRVGRYGGEEFVVILNGRDAAPFLRRLRTEWTRRRPCLITFSAGVAPARAAPHHALAAADRAMYRAKVGGRDQWKWATPDEYA